MLDRSNLAVSLISIGRDAFCPGGGGGGVIFRFLWIKKVLGSAKSSLLSSPESELVTALMPSFIILLLELEEVVGTLDKADVEENEVVGGGCGSSSDCSAAASFGGSGSRVNCGGASGGRRDGDGDGISTAFNVLLVAELLGVLASGVSSDSSSVCESADLFWGVTFCGVFLGDGRVGKVIVWEDMILEAGGCCCEPWCLGGDEATGGLEPSFGLDGFGEETTISSSITSFAGMRFLGIEKGLKKSLMNVLFAGACRGIAA